MPLHHACRPPADVPSEDRQPIFQHLCRGVSSAPKHRSCWPLDSLLALFCRIPVGFLPAVVSANNCLCLFLLRSFDTFPDQELGPAAPPNLSGSVPNMGSLAQTAERTASGMEASGRAQSCVFACRAGLEMK